MRGPLLAVPLGTGGGTPAPGSLQTHQGRGKEECGRPPLPPGSLGESGRGYSPLPTRGPCWTDASPAPPLRWPWEPGSVSFWRLWTRLCASWHFSVPFRRRKWEAGFPVSKCVLSVPGHLRQWEGPLPLVPDPQPALGECGQALGMGAEEGPHPASGLLLGVCKVADLGFPRLEGKARAAPRAARWPFSPGPTLSHGPDSWRQSPRQPQISGRLG